MKNKLLFTFVVAIFIIALLGVASAVVLASFAPFHAGDKLYDAQFWVEHQYQGLIKDPTQKAYYGLTLLERRLHNLEQVSGSEAEPAVLNSIYLEIGHSLELFKSVPPENESDIRAIFISQLDKLLTMLDSAKYAASNMPDALTNFKSVISTLREQAQNSADELGKLSEGGSIPALPLTASSSLPQGLHGQAFSPRVIPFPPGSSAAKHAFFPLDGKHAQISCQTCHTEGNYSGTPNQCTDCHLANRPAAHFDGQCALCHSTTAWLPSTFDHAAVGAVDCQSCHLDRQPANHFPGQCSACHTTTAWLPANFNHQLIGAVDCQSCHLSRRPANHFSGQCSACHTTASWLPANFNHQVAGATDCQSCHAAKRPAGHFSGQCSACHATTGWLPASFNHQFAGATDCQGCHAATRPAGHFAGQCSSCHNTSAWRPASFNHAAAGATDCQSCHSATRPANHFSGQCSSCHSTNGWLPANFNHSFPIDHHGANGQCATCHPSGTDSFTCFNCHNQSELTKKHNEEGIPDFVARCMECHSDGRKHD